MMLVSRSSHPSRNLSRLMMGLALLAGHGLTWAAEPVSLQEMSRDQVFAVTTKVTVTGQLQAPTKEGNAVALKLDVNAVFDAQERGLPGAGRDAEAFRSVRRYTKTQAKIQVAEQVSQPTLRKNVQLIVAEGRREGTRMFSPAGPLTSDEVELLRTPADTLPLLALLPDDDVELDDKWKPAEWVLQFLAGIEAVEKSSLECHLKSIKENIARIEFTGEISGGIYGASSEIKLTGHYLFDLEQKALVHAELSQTESRTASPVSPGLKVTATAVVDRQPLTTASVIGEEELKGIPLEPNPATLLLMFESKEAAARIYYDRSWALFFPGPPTAVFRMLDRGALIAQCNLSPIPNAGPGKHVAQEDFQKDVQRALGEGFGKFLQSEVVPSEDKNFIYRVVATGESKVPQGKDEIKVIPMMWIYYLIASPEGRQIVLVFTVEATLLERFQTQDISIATGLEFLPSQGPGIVTPAKSTQP